MLVSSLLVVLALSSAPATPQRSAALKTMNAGVELATKGDWTGAEAQIREAIEHDPALGEAWLNLGHVLRRQGRLEEAAKSLRSGTAVSEGAVAAELHYELGRVLLASLGDPVLDHDQRSQRAKDAIKELKQVLETQPRRASAWYRLARAHEFLEAPVEADEAYRRAIEIDPRQASAYVGLAFMYIDYGHEAIAVAVLETNTLVNDDDAEAWAGLGSAMVQLRRPKDAIDALRKAVAINPDHLPARFAMGMAYAELRDRKAAAEHLTRFLEQAGDDVPDFKKVAASRTLARMKDVF